MSVSIRGSFRRSVHLVRDFYGAGDLSGYVVTSKALETTGRLADALATPGSTRAWSVSGPYGGGKSSFALFASRLLQGGATAQALLAAADAALAERMSTALPGAFCPVLVVGSRVPVVSALAHGLARALESFAADVPAGRGTRSDVAAQAAALADDVRGATDEAAVLDAYDRAADLVRQRTGGGLVLVVDELGKHLEYASLHPADGDLFVLQSLAERASQASGAPILVLTVLHQAFERYAVGLSSAQRDDWRKVQGRFEDVAYVEPTGETLRLLADAIEADLPPALAAEGEAAVGAVLAAATLPRRLDADAVAESLARSLPLHPAVALLVGPLFRRLAQNERSLFSFLASGEPKGFLDVMGEKDALYRLDHLYDYLTGALGGSLYHDGSGQLWAETEAALTRVAGDALQERMLKQVAVLSFAGALAGLAPSEDVLVASSGASPAATTAALDALRSIRAVSFRTFRKEYRVWEGSDFDLASALAQARAEVPLQTPLATLLERAAPPEPLVARRHAFATGTSRIFDVAYTDEAGWRSLLPTAPDRTDGRVVYVLPEHDASDDVIAALAAATREAEAPLQLFCVPDGVVGLRDLARDLAALDWVRAHDSDLDGDKTARREVDEQRADLRASLAHRLAEALAPDRGTWVRAGDIVPVGAGGLQPVLSDACDHVFDQAPRVWNELLNRRNPSSSAVRAQKQLIQAMNESASHSALGIDGTPAEYGLYVSVLQTTGLHQPDGEAWAFVDPGRADGVDPGSAAALRALADALRASRARPVAVPDLYDRLRQPPFGVRDGLLPVFLFAALARLGDDVAMFEDGVYQWSLSYEAVERLLRGPEAFSIQWVAATPDQAAALSALVPRLGLAESAGPVKPLAVVGRILQAVSGLPAFVRKTTGLSDTATAVREALVHATEPAALLFWELPGALGLDAFGEGEPADVVRQRAAAFADALADALRELSTAYDDLLADLDGEVRAAFDLRGATPDARRAELAARSRALSGEAVDLQLRSFIVRAADDLADTRAWTESLAALLARTPPAQWSDADRKRFTAALADVARTFLTREAVSFAPDEDSDPARAVTRFRLSVTATHEEERQTVVSVHPEDAATVRDVALRVSQLLADADASLDTQLAALSQLSLALLERRSGRSDAVEDLLATLPLPDDDLPDHD